MTAKIETNSVTFVNWRNVDFERESKFWMSFPRVDPIGCYYALFRRRTPLCARNRKYGSKYKVDQNCYSGKFCTTGPNIVSKIWEKNFHTDPAFIVCMRAARVKYFDKSFRSAWSLCTPSRTSFPKKNIFKHCKNPNTNRLIIIR